MIRYHLKKATASFLILVIYYNHLTSRLGQNHNILIGKNFVPDDSALYKCRTQWYYQSYILLQLLEYIHQIPAYHQNVRGAEIEQQKAMVVSEET